MNFIHEPDWYYLIPLIIFLLGYLFYLLKLINTSQLLKTKLSKTVFIKFFFRLLVICCMTIALLGPFIESQPDKVTIDQKKIIFILDVSLSMKCLDIEPSRIDKAKSIIKQITEKNKNDLLALITYSSSATILCPYTKDKNAFQLFLSIADNRLYNHHGSVPSDAWNVVGKLINLKDTIPTIIVLFTDGQSLDEINCNSNIFNENTYIYSIGIGSHIGTVVPINKLISNSGSFPISKLDKEKLKKFNECINGTYFECSDENNDTKNIIDAIVYFQQKLNHQKQLDRANNMYLYFLWPAIILLLLDIIFIFKSIKI